MFCLMISIPGVMEGQEVRIIAGSVIISNTGAQSAVSVVVAAVAHSQNHF